MYLRKVQVRASNGTHYEYLRLQENYRKRLPSGKFVHRQRVVCSLGRADLLEPHAARLYELLTGQPPAQPQAVNDDSVQAWGWGPLLVLRALWERHLELDRHLRRLGQHRQDPSGRDLAERAFVLVANRLIEPSSEHGLAHWLDTDFVCNDRGRRWLPRWRDEQQRRASKSPRVQVDCTWLQRWYRALDRLLACQSDLEVSLFEQLRTLFEVDVQLALYDMTSTYFEGSGPAGLAAHGYSRDQRPRNPQVVVGLVLIDGWPIAHHVFEGNRKDDTTVGKVVKDLQQRFGLRRIVFVGDRGMISEAVRQSLEEAECGYLIGLPRRSNADAAEILRQAGQTPLKQWTAVDAERVGQPDGPRGMTRVLEVESKRSGKRWFAVHSEERQEYEQQQRQREQEKLKQKLDRLEKRVAAGRLKKEKAIAAAAERILQRHHGRRHVQVQVGAGQFSYQASRRAELEVNGEGHYLLETTETGLTAVGAVREYKRLMQVEACFAQLKDVIEMRPIWHRRPERVRGHILVATLALLLQRLLDRELKAAGEDLSANAALKALSTVKLVEFETDEGTRKQVVSQGTVRARRILKALKIKRSPPPKSVK